MSKKLIAVALGVMVFAMVFASAAGLGGARVGQVGAEADIVASCDSDGVTVNFTTAWDAAAAAFVVTHVVLTELGSPEASSPTSCDGQSASVTVAGGGVELGTGSILVADGSATVELSSAAPAADIDHVAIVITGITVITG